MNIKEELVQKGYSILASNGYNSCDTGIKPIVDRLNENIAYFAGLTVADKVVGKASAVLLVKSNVKEVYALVLSKSGKEILDKYNIIYHYDELTDYIINRKKTGMCPMEEAIKDIDDLDECYKVLMNKVTNI